ncbi:MAG: cadherin-like beta sandwich domain-containing protein [Erysipelotrichaceae bacterium]|nr:cadherin-like beta sandwich domain-containing protein [Erysipelotrichaceae bacterium]
MKTTKNLISKAGKCLLVFGILFSQLSFPLSVLADEISNEKEGNVTETTKIQQQTTDIISNETNEENNKTKNNEIEVTKEEVQTEEELPEAKEEEINFTVELESDACIIRNKLNTTITLKELKQVLENIVKVTDEDDNEIEETEILHSGDQVTILDENQTEVEYFLVIFGDYDDDGMITEEDQQILLNILKTNLTDEELTEILSFLDLNQDEKFNILDVTYPIFTENTWENQTEATDELENYLKASEETVYVGEEIEVNYIIEGFNIDTLAGIEGTLNYNKELLELTNIKVNGVEENILELDHDYFAYLLEDYNQDGVLITLTFKALAIGNPNVEIENIMASIGGAQAKIDFDKASTIFEIAEYGKGGDEEETKEENQIPQPTTPKTEQTKDSEPTTTTTTNLTPTPVATVKKVALSSDNYIKSLTIKGYKIDFDKNTYEYSINVKNSVSSLDLDIVLNSDLATYTVEGNQNFKVGENTVNIIVKAEDGSTKTYSIKVNKEKKEDNTEEEEQEESSSSKTVIIILIILVIIGLIYVIFKDDEEDNKESKK